MSLGGPSDPLGAVAAGALNANARPLREALGRGWITGRIIAVQEGGAYRVGTAFGQLLLQAAAGRFQTGEAVRLRLDPGSGQMVAEPARAGGPGAQAMGAQATGSQTTGRPAAGGAAAGQAGTPGAGTGAAMRAGSGTGPAPASAGGGLLQPGAESAQIRADPAAALLAGRGNPAIQAAILSGLAPVSTGAPAAEGALASVFPQAGSPVFSLIAALFPALVIDGRLAEMARRARRRYGGPGRYARAAETALAEDEPAADDGTAAPVPTAGRIEWSMPLFSGEAMLRARWQLDHGVPPAAADPSAADPTADGAEAEAAPDADTAPGLHARLEITLDRHGRVVVDGWQDARTITVRVTSGQALGRELAAAIEARAQALARGLNRRLSLQWTLAPTPR